MTLDTVPMLPLTLANEQTIRPHYDRTKAFCQERGAARMLQTIARLRKADSGFAELVDEVGRPNPSWAEKQVRIMLANDAAFHEAGEAKGEPLTEAKAAEIVKADHDRVIRDYFTQKPEVARQMYFDFGAFPVTLEALKFGRGVIIACADYDALDAMHGANACELLRSEGSDFWQNVDASEVAAWMDRFCEAWQ